MTAVLVSFLFLAALGIPISFCLLASSLIFLNTASIPLSSAIQRIVGGVYNFPLLAVPFFILAGNLMNLGGITRKIFDFADVCVGHIPGGLGHTNVLASIIFAGMSGSAVADAGGLGQVELKAMRDAGYDDDFSVAITAASSIIGPIIPPSIVAVLFSVFSGVSIGRLFIGGVIPGLLMGLSLSVMIYFQSKKRNYKTRPRAHFSEFIASFWDALPSLMTPVILIGGTLSGVCTPTEASIVAVIYAMILGFCYRELRVRDLPRMFKETVSVSANVAFIIACSSLFGWVTTRAQIAKVMAAFFAQNISSPIITLILLNIMLLIVGMLLDNSAAIGILTPVLIPIILQYNIDPVHFGIIMIVNLVIGLLTPPVGMVLYVMSSITKMPIMRITKAMMPYIFALIMILYIITFVPSIVTFLPNLLYGK